MKKWYKIPNPDCHIRCILTGLLLQFEPYFEPKWPNSAKMKKAKLAFWPTFSFLLRSLLLLFLWSRAAVDFKTWFGLLLLFFTNATKQRWSLGGLGSGGGAAALAKLTGRLLLREHKVHDFPLNFRLLPYRWQISFRNIICALFCAPFFCSKKGFCSQTLRSTFSFVLKNRAPLLSILRSFY